MGLKKNRRNAKISPNQTFFGSDDLSYTGPNTSSIIYIFLPVVYTQESQGMLKFILSFVRAEKIISLYLEKKQTHFASEELLKQPLCAVFFYALILFPTLS